MSAPPHRVNRTGLWLRLQELWQEDEQVPGSDADDEHQSQHEWPLLLLPLVRTHRVIASRAPRCDDESIQPALLGPSAMATSRLRAFDFAAGPTAS